MNFGLRLAAVFLTGMACTSAFANDVVTINVSGTMARAPCTLTSSKTFSASFGSILTDQINSASSIDIPITLNCPANSSLNISVKASGVYQGTPTIATTTKDNLVYTLRWKSDGTSADLQGVPLKLTNQSGNVNLSLTAKLIAITAQTPGSFSASSVISMEYL